ncbi:hypothetical protein NODU109028_18090 [Nocardioides dubius]|uniref:hypothetical protein n=1 Tax=Nocardioides dubius TaxID=317019 RepID=UPI0039E8528A
MPALVRVRIESGAVTTVAIVQRELLGWLRHLPGFEGARLLWARGGLLTLVIETDSASSADALARAVAALPAAGSWRIEEVLVAEEVAGRAKPPPLPRAPGDQRAR